MNRTIIAIVVLAILAYGLFSSIFVINARQQAIVTRFGEISRVIDEPGLYFKVPSDIVEAVQVIEKRVLRYDLEDIRVQVSDGRFYLVDAFLTYRIANPQLFRERAQGSLIVAEGLINSRFESALRDVYGRRDFNAALSAERTNMMQQAQESISEANSDLGIEVVDVRILRTDLTAEVSQQTYDRMSAERLAEAAFLRARGRELAQTLRAQADRQVIEILAAAQRDSEILRGEGDAERNSIFAEAYSVDPEFFEFYRTMQSYRTALQDEGTTLVLSPNSEFFEYFSANLPEGVTLGAVQTGTLPEFEVQEEPEALSQEDLVFGNEDSNGVLSSGGAEEAPAAAGQ